MIKLLGIPYDANSSFLRGSAKAPPLIRIMHHLGASNPSTERGKMLSFSENLVDCGDLIFDSEKGVYAYSIITNRVSELIEDGSKLISLGGDHSITYPIIEAYSRMYPNLHILHFDAHSDLYDLFEDNYYSHASPFARIMEQKLTASLTQVGVRTMCLHQRIQAKKFEVRIIEMKDFNPEFASHLKGPLYISFDLDVLDPAFAPGVSHPEPGGMTTREVIQCLHKVHVSVVGADIVEYNPDRDINDQTAMVAYRILKEIWALM
jgi:agmatinase